MQTNQKVVNSEAKKKPIIFSFFSGSGFLDLGFNNSGFDIRFVNEFYKPFLEAYKYSRSVMFEEDPIYGYHQCSIDEFKEGEARSYLLECVAKAKAEALVGFIGGPPCPDFSSAGKNKGREGENGRLTESYVDTIIDNQPDFFLLENVKGLWKTKKHKLFYNEMKEKLEKSGYLLTDTLANSIEFGVPQFRERVILFGINKQKFNSKVHETLSESFDWKKYTTYNALQIESNLAWPHKNDYFENSELLKPRLLSPKLESLTVEHWFIKNSVNKHPNAAFFFKPRQGILKFQTISEGDVKGKSFKRLHRWRYSPTVAYGNNEVHLHPYKSRRLSVAEALSLQSMPKEFELPKTMSLSDMFKTIGNGVPYLFAKGIAMNIHDFISQANE